MKCYFIPLNKINEWQAASIELLIARCGRAHHTDIDMRINGANERVQADWIKHMLVMPEVDDLTAARIEIADLQKKLARANMQADYYKQFAPPTPADAGSSRPETPQDPR